MQIYQAFGLTVHSALPLPQWRPAPPGLVADLTARRGDVPVKLAEVAGTGASFACNDREVLVRLEGRFGMHLHEGRTATLHVEPGTPESVPRLFFQNVALGVLLHQRGKVVLHACAVSVGGAGAAVAVP